MRVDGLSRDCVHLPCTPLMLTYYLLLGLHWFFAYRMLLWCMLRVMDVLMSCHVVLYLLRTCLCTVEYSGVFAWPSENY